MKILALMVAAYLAVGMAWAQETPRAAVFDVYTWDFGTIREADGDVSHVFHLLNNSNSPVVVSRAIPGCSCISASFSSEPVLPGKMGDVVVSFSPSGAVGETFRTIELADAAGASLGTLSTRAEVIPADRSIQERYYYVLADLLYANQTHILFGYAFPGVSMEKSVYIANASDRTLSLRAEHAGPDGLDVACPATLEPEEEAVITLSFAAPADCLYQTRHDTVWLLVDGRRVRVPIVTSAICMEPVPESSDAPDMQTYPSLGKLSAGWFSATLTGTIDVSNKGRSDLVIRAVEAPDDVVVHLPAGTVIRPGATLRVKAETSSNEAFRVALFTNDPQRPFKELIFKKLY